MPTAFDIGKYTTDYNPIAGGPFVSIQDVMSEFGNVFQEIISLLPQLLKLIEDLPQEFLSIVEQLFQTFIDFVFPANGGESPLLTAVIGIITNSLGAGGGGLITQIINMMITLFPQLVTALMNLLGTTGGSSLLTQIVSLLIQILPSLLTSLTSLIGTAGGASVLGQLTSLGASVFTSPLGMLTGFTSGVPILNQLVSAGGGNTGAPNLLTEFTNIFGGGGAGLPAIFTSGLDTGVALLSQLPSVLTWPLSSLGLGTLPAGIGLGSLAQVPGLSGLLGGLDTTGGTSLLTQLPSLLSLPLSAVPALLTLFGGLGTGTSLLSQLANVFFNTSGSTNSTLGLGGANLLSLLGNPLGLLSGGFNPISAGMSMLQNVLTPAGALSTFTQLPGHLFGVLAPGNLTNMLPDPSFTDPAYFDDPDMWDGTVGRTTPLGSLKFTANGSYQQYIGVPIGSDASQVTNVGVYAFWQGLVVTAGQTITLAVEALDANGAIIPNPTGRVVMSITNPTADSASYPGAPTQQPPVPAQGTAGWDGQAIPGWVYLSGPYRPPAGTSYIAISPEITAQTQSGPVHFDDGYMMPDQGLLDSSILSNFQNLLDGSIPGTKIGGLQGIEDMITTWTQHVDGLFNAVNDGPTQSNVPFFQLFNLMQLMSLNAGNAQTLAASNTNILGNKVNKPAITGGTQPSGEANFTHATMPDTTTLPTTALASGQAMAGWIRVGQAASKGFVDFLAAKAASGTTGISMNLYKQNITTGTKTNVYASPDISSVIPASTTVIPSVSQMLIPGGLNVSPNDVLWAEIVNLSGSNLLVGKRSTPFPDHFNTHPRNIGHTRTVATLGASPATLTTADIVTSQTAPIFNTGIASVPADYHLPQMDNLPPSPSSGAGNYDYTIPTFIVAGDLLDLIVVGGGGSGMSEWDAGIMSGGLGGTPNGRQFVYGSDVHGTGLPVIPTGTTKLRCAVGAGGPHPGGYWANGNPGTDSVWTCLDGPSAGTELLRGAGGAGGSNSVGLSSGTGSGPTPNPFVFDGKSYAMGQNVGINATGSIPGGGGGGATWYELGGSGARGQGWVFAQKYVSP